MKLWFAYRTKPAKPGEIKHAVLRAKSELTARKAVASICRSEGPEVWMNDNDSVFARLLAGGEAQFILESVQYDNPHSASQLPETQKAGSDN